MPEPTREQLRDQLESSQARCSAAEARVAELQAELDRTREWRKSALLAVVVVALLAVLMLGIVAFNAVDDQDTLGLLSAA